MGVDDYYKQRKLAVCFHRRIDGEEEEEEEVESYEIWRHLVGRNWFGAFGSEILYGESEDQSR